MSKKPAMANVQVQIKKTVLDTILSRSLPVNEELHYKLYNSGGELAFSKTIVLINPHSTVLEDLDVSHLPKGDYRLCISSGNKDTLLEQINISI